MEIRKETLLLRAEIYCHLLLWKTPLRGLFGASSPRPEPHLLAPQPIAPTKNIEYQIPSGMIEQLLANPYAGDGTKHPDMHLIYVDCLSLQVYPEMKLRRRFSLYL